MLYKTKPLNYRPLGVTNATRAMLTADGTEGLIYRVSCDGGQTYRVVKLNEPFTPHASNGRFVVEIKFPTSSGKTGIYTLNASGVFPLSVGTTVYFKSGADTFSTVIGPDGRYNITLPRGLYEVWYRKAGTKQILATQYNPDEHVYRQPDDLDKENTIELFLNNVSWAEFAVYDTFKDSSKVDPASNAKIDLQQNLTDEFGNTVRYWALVFMRDEPIEIEPI